MKPNANIISYRPHNEALLSLIDEYKNANYLPTRNAAINHILCLALFKGETPKTTEPLDIHANHFDDEVLPETESSWGQF